MEVAEVDGIKGAAEDSNFPHFKHRAGVSLGQQGNEKHEFCKIRAVGRCR